MPVQPACPGSSSTTPDPKPGNNSISGYTDNTISGPDTRFRIVEAGRPGLVAVDTENKLWVRRGQSVQYPEVSIIIIIIMIIVIVIIIVRAPPGLF